MKKNPLNGWFSRLDIVSFFDWVIRTAIRTPSKWINTPHLKYIDIRVDMRSGDFIVKDMYGKEVPVEDLKKLFPQIFKEENAEG